MPFVRHPFLAAPGSTPALATASDSAQISTRTYRYGSTVGAARGLDGARR